MTEENDIIKVPKKRKIISSYGSKVVGGYEITGQQNHQHQIYFNFTKKPKLINRLFCQWCLGWTWVDK